MKSVSPNTAAIAGSTSVAIERYCAPRSTNRTPLSDALASILDILRYLRLYTTVLNRTINCFQNSEYVPACPTLGDEAFRCLYAVDDMSAVLIQVIGCFLFLPHDRAILHSQT